METMNYKVASQQPNKLECHYQYKDPYCLEDDYSDEEPEIEDEEDFYDQANVKHPEYWL